MHVVNENYFQMYPLVSKSFQNNHQREKEKVLIISTNILLQLH